MKKRRVRKIEDGRAIVILAGQERQQRLEIKDGDRLGVRLRQTTVIADVAPEVEAAYQRSWATREGAYRYLANH